MELEDLKNKSAEELQTMLLEKKEELRVLRFKASEQQLKQLHLVKSLKREIAQILSLLQNNAVVK